MIGHYYLYYWASNSWTSVKRFGSIIEIRFVNTKFKENIMGPKSEFYRIQNTDLFINVEFGR